MFIQNGCLTGLCLLQFLLPETPAYGKLPFNQNRCQIECHVRKGCQKECLKMIPDRMPDRTLVYIDARKDGIGTR